jgi:hypothetical protein
MIGALVAGQVGSGGASLSSFESIATTAGTGSSNTITFSSIPSGFKHLQLRGYTYGSGGGASNARITFNGDTGSNYASHYLLGDGASASASGAASQTFAWYSVYASSAGSTNGIPVTIVDILDYGSTSKYKTIRVLSGYDNNGSGRIYVYSGLYMSTSAITSFDLKNEDGSNWSTNTRYALYGIKEA